MLLIIKRGRISPTRPYVLRYTFITHIGGWYVGKHIAENGIKNKRQSGVPWPTRDRAQGSHLKFNVDTTQATTSRYGTHRADGGFHKSNLTTAYPSVPRLTAPLSPKNYGITQQMWLGSLRETSSKLQGTLLQRVKTHWNEVWTYTDKKDGKWRETMLWRNRLFRQTN